MKILRQTPILVVDKIEPNLEFYEKRLGYKRLAEVPHGSGLGFIMLEQNGNHLMMQTRSSIADDLGASAADAASREKLLQSMRGLMITQFVIVDSIDAAMECVKGLKLLVPLRTTNYGMKEIVVQDTAGFPIVFAQEIAQM
jgi:uncharacterized glyoxalase superfamily protein PhnB